MDVRTAVCEHAHGVGAARLTDRDRYLGITRYKTRTLYTVLSIDLSIYRSIDLSIYLSARLALARGEHGIGCVLSAHLVRVRVF